MKKGTNEDIIMRFLLQKFQFGNYGHNYRCLNSKHISDNDQITHYNYQHTHRL